MTTKPRAQRFRAAVDDAAFEVAIEGPVVRLTGPTDPTDLDTNEGPQEFNVHPLDTGSLRIEPATDASSSSHPLAPSHALGGRGRRGPGGVGEGPLTSPTRGKRAPSALSALAEVAPMRAEVATSGDTTWVFIDGEVWTIEVEPAERVRRARAGSGSDGLSAPMPATVIRILTEPGRDVRRGDTLLLLEAMKMELPVRAPRDGRIAAVRCQAGELVQPGVALVDFE